MADLAGLHVVLPWPPAELSPNSRKHWAARSRAAKAYRLQCHVLAKAARLSSPGDGAILLELEFFPPDRRRRDDDNMLASFKAGRDGIADAMGVDDSRFRTLISTGSAHPQGKVVVRIRPYIAG